MIRAAAFLLLATPAAAQELDVEFQDGNPLDSFIVFNTGCPLTDATIILDFTTSQGGILIDTEYGGPGSRDPMDATLTEGDARLRPVRDGDQMLRVDVATLPNTSAITVTMDVDDTVGFWEDARVFTTGEEVAGTTVTLTINDTTTTTTLDDTGRSRITIPATAAACPLS